MQYKNSVFKTRLIKAREEAGFDTARAFADALSINEYRYRRYERDESRPDYQTLIKIGEKTGKKLEWLLGGFGHRDDAGQMLVECQDFVTERKKGCGITTATKIHNTPINPTSSIWEADLSDERKNEIIRIRELAIKRDLEILAEYAIQYKDELERDDPAHRGRLAKLERKLFEHIDETCDALKSRLNAPSEWE